jgi:5-methylcytosine-specific restriction endonuclease McrA
MLMGGSSAGAPAMALDIHYPMDEYEKPITDKIESFDVCDWEWWLALEPRRGDLDKVIHTSRRIIRIPTVIVCSHFSQMPRKRQKPTPHAIRKRDGNKCQYTGKPLTQSTFSLDHVIPRSKGGRDTWENLVSCHKHVNFKKGDKLNKEAGLRLLNKPVAPREIPLCALYPENKHVDHQHF